MRLLPPFDPYLDQRDRDTLCPTRAVRKRARTGIGAPGVVLVDGDLAGLWRPQKKGKRLVVTVEPLSAGGTPSRRRDRGRGAVLAPHRGAKTGEVSWA